MTTVSLDLARQLKEAGWPQDESLLWWVEFYNTSSTTPDELFSTIVSDEAWEYGEPSDRSGPYIERSFLKKLKRYAAPTTEEILKMLPDDVKIKRGRKNYWQGYYCLVHPCIDSPWEIKLCDSCAWMWLYLKKNNLLPPSPHAL